MAAPKPVEYSSLDNNIPMRDAVDVWVETKTLILREERKLDLLKRMLKVDEEALTEQMIESTIKTIKHPDGNVTLTNAVFGSVNKDFEKEDVIPVIERYDEFVDSIKYEPTLNSKTLGTMIREKRDYAFTIWQAKQAAGSPQPPFSADLFLPPDLVKMLNVSEEFTVRFTPNRET